MTGLSGVRVVVEHELRLRVRAGRWTWLLGAWFVVLLAFTVFEWWAIDATAEGPVSDEDIGSSMFAGLMMLVLALGLLVVPSLTAQAVNGDRERGVLASLQVSLLTPLDIALGKLLAAWLVALVFLATTLPMVGWCLLLGGVGIGRALVTLLVVALLLGCVAAVALLLSSLLARSTTSVVLSYVAVFALGIGTLVTFGLALATTQTTEPVPGEPGFTQTTVQPERVWWLLAPNPFAILADASPRVSEEVGEDVGEADILSEIGDAVRSTRDSGDGDPAPVWPVGLGMNLVLAGASVALTARRLRTPYRVLPRAVRVA